MTAIALIDGLAHPVAWDFYRVFPVDPVAPAGEQMHVTQRHRIDDMTWASLLEGLRTHVPDRGNALVVSHGTSRGIHIPLFAGGPVLDADGLYDIASSLVSTPEQAVRRIGLQDADIVRRFRRALTAVVDKRLSRIELRACNVGTQPHVVERIRSLFNLDYFGCPNARDSFFGMQPTRVRPNGLSVDQWHDQHPTLAAPMSWHDWDRLYPRQHRHEYTTQHGRVSLYYREVADHRLECELAAERVEAVREWVGQKIPQGHWTSGPLPLHAFVGSPPIFPGEPGYRSRLRSSMRVR